MTAVVRVRRFQEICIIAPQLLLLLLLLLLPLPLSRSYPCPITVEHMNVSTTSDAEGLAEALLCDGPAAFTVSWNGEIMSSRTLHVSNGSTLNVTGSSENSADTIITSDGTVLLFQVDLESTVLLTGLTLFGGDGALRVTGGSFVEVINCSFTQNKRTSSDQGGAIYADDRSNVSFGGDTLFDNNTATHGGAIYTIDSSELDVRKGGAVAFVGNQAVGSGGAIGLFAQGAFNNYGAASFLSNEAGFGGAIHADNHSSVSFGGDSVFASNTATDGGAIYAIDRSELDVREEGRVAFVGNQAVDSGGAIYAVDHISVSFGGETVFANNTATDGGAVYVHGSSVVLISETFFRSNTAIYGGAIAVVNGSIIHVEGVTSFKGNEATDDGGAIHARNSSVLVETRTLFMFNVALNGSGGGVYASRSVIALIGAEFKENHGARGGGVASSHSISDEKPGGIGPSRITGCYFDGNTATEGGAIYSAEGFDEVANSSFTSNYAVVQGGAFLHSGTLEVLTECIFESNVAGEDGLAVTIFGLIDDITNLTFRTNSFYCASGKYALDTYNVWTEEFYTCRWDVVCSHCTELLCDAPVGINVDEYTHPFCEVVPDGVTTTGNGGMTVETFNLMPGFYREGNWSTDVLECYRKEACVGGSDASRYCKKGYKGRYCAACEEGYRSGFQYSCHSCHGAHKWAVIGGAATVSIVVIFVVVFGVAYLVGVEDRPNSERSGMWERRVSNFREGLVRIIPLTAVKIVLVCWQIITQFSSVVNVRYPPLYENFLAALNVVNLNLGSILSLLCVVETNFYTRLTLVTIAPVAVLGVLAITYQIAISRNGHSIRAKQMAKNKHLSVGLFILFIVYSSVSQTIFQAFDLDDRCYLRADYDVSCFNSRYSGFTVYAACMILIYPVGIPAVFAWALYINRDGIKSVAGTTDRSQVPLELEAIKDLWAPYKRSRYYYEVIECGRRILLTSLAILTGAGSTTHVAIDVLFVVFFFSIFENLSPFADPLNTWLYRFGTWVVFLNMYLALLLKIDEYLPHQDVFAGLLITVHVGMVLIVIANALLSALKRIREVRAVEMPVRTQGPFQYRSTLILKSTGNARATPEVNIPPV